jgi:tellurite resistance protein
MTDQERQALLALAIMAAMADGREDASEQAELQRIAERMSLGGDVSASTLYQDVVQKRVTLDQAASALASPEAKMLAHELCVGVCHADGALSDPERTFLYALETRLGFDPQQAAAG